jgi:hypothetical protein
MTEIRPQSETHRVNGGLPGPAAVRNQVRAVTLRVEALPNGRLRVSTPTTPGWAAVARTQAEFMTAIRQAFVEAQVAAYAAWRNHEYDLAETVSRGDPDPLVAAPASRTQRRAIRKDQYDPDAWSITSDGRWRSPSGRLYQPDSTMVSRVKAARLRAGLD